MEALNHEPFAFDPAGIDAVLLTHAHLDHSGLLPKLWAEGFRGAIWCTEPTRDLLSVMLADAARLNEQEAERRNRRSDRADEPPIAPIYTLADAERAMALVSTAGLEQQFAPAPGFKACFWNAGHILGSASVELFAGGVRLLFSGDIGPEHKSFQLPPEAPSGIDHVFCESTYGDRIREDLTTDARRDLLREEVKAALARGGNLLIPAFALERTQELLLDLAQLINAGQLNHTPIFIDSPLAPRTTEIFHKYRAALEDMESAEIFRHPAFHYVQDASSSMRLNDMSGAIILAGSGMCEGGRIRHHLLHNLPRKGSTILFVGFQAKGTLGRTILEGARRVRISGHDVAVRAAVRRIQSYSAHADQEGLVGWIRSRRPIRGSLFLTHGEAAAMAALHKQFDGELESIVVPELGERYELPPGAPARRVATGRVELRAAINRDWQNDYADFAANLKSELRHIEDAKKRAEAIAMMKRVLETYRA